MSIVVNAIDTRIPVQSFPFRFFFFTLSWFVPKTHHVTCTKGHRTCQVNCAKGLVACYMPKMCMIWTQNMA